VIGSPNSSRICDDGYACLAPDCSCENKPNPSPFQFRPLTAVVPVRNGVILFGADWHIVLRWSE
jgi:hypothetical protein